MILKMLNYYYKLQLKIIKPYYNWKNKRLIAKAEQIRQLNDIKIQITQTKLPDIDIIDQETLHESQIKRELWKSHVIDGVVLVIGGIMSVMVIIGEVIFDKNTKG